MRASHHGSHDTSSYAIHLQPLGCGQGDGMAIVDSFTYYNELMQDRDEMVTTLVELLKQPAWHAHAACRGQDTDGWFPERGQPTGPAKALCATCTVRAECLDYALQTSVKFGVWGGMSERERRRIRRGRAVDQRRAA